jgi:hypothetical protein
MEYILNNMNDVFKIKPEHFEEFIEDIKRLYPINHKLIINNIKINSFKFTPDGKKEDTLKINIIKKVIRS